MSKSKTVTLPRDLVGAVIAIITDSETSAGQQFIKECWAVDILVEAMKQPDASITTSVPVGWKLVPVEPTDGMDAAAETDYEKFNGGYFPNWKHAYRAMLAAAPQLPTTEQSLAVQSQVERVPYLWYDPENGDTWTQEAVDEGFCVTDNLIPLYTK